MCKPSVPPTHEEIELAAYFLWLNAATENEPVAESVGPQHFWFTAEEQLSNPVEEEAV